MLFRCIYVGEGREHKRSCERLVAVNRIESASIKRHCLAEIKLEKIG